MKRYHFVWLLYMTFLPVSSPAFCNSLSTRTGFLARSSSSGRRGGCSFLLKTSIASKHSVANHRGVHNLQWAVDPETLMDMDVVIYSDKNDYGGVRRLAAVQEDGGLAPLSAWTEEPAFGTSIEFLVDEEYRFPALEHDKIIIHSVVPQDALSYGSRQVGGGMGPGNPHGEESEMLYYIEENLLKDITYDVNPDLEIFW
jgi:hypothetical protein